MLNEKKSYKHYEKKYIGESDVASLILAGCIKENGLKTQPLHFAGDGYYYAYIVDEDALIGDHYKKVASFSYWLRIYDDIEKTFEANADTINIYRAGDFGCIVQLIGRTNQNGYPR